MQQPIRRGLCLLLLLALVLSLMPVLGAVPTVHAANLSTDLYQLPSRTLNDAGTKYRQNMSYIIRTRNGKIIVVDGGYSTNNSDANYLISQLKSITGKDVPNVDAWFFTHDHGDHVGAFKAIAARMPTSLTVSAVYYRFPTDAEIDKYAPESSRASLKTSVQSFRNHVALMKQADGTPTQTVTLSARHVNRCNATFNIDTVQIDVLMTCEEVFWGCDNITTKYSGNLDNNGKAYTSQTIQQLVNADFGNNTSAVFRMTTAGKTVLFLGDAAEPEGLMLKYYHDKNTANANQYFSLKSDVVQMAHHGQNAVPKSVYTAIKPSIALWPAPDWVYSPSSASGLTTNYTKQWMSALGVTNYVSKDGLKKISFSDLRTDVQPTIPPELKPLVFDATYYANKYPDVKNAFGTDETKLYAHFLKYGVEEGRCASPYFDVKYYMSQNSLRLSTYCDGDYEKGFDHFLKYAFEEAELTGGGAKKLSPLFDCKYYYNTYPILKELGLKNEFEILQYFVNTGKAAGHKGAADVVTLNGGVVYHTVAQISAVAPTCTTAGKTAGTKCATCGLILQAQSAVEPKGHSYNYTSLGDEHRVTCNNCSLSSTEAHSFAEGLCICGETETKEPVVDPSLKLNHSLNLASDISVNLLVSKTLLEGFDMNTVYMESTVETAEGTSTQQISPVESDYYYYFTLDGLTAVQMNDKISSILYGTKDGQPYCSPVDEYSIATYAYSQMNHAARDESLKILCADLLRYGAKAQIFKSYRTDRLADANMTETHRSLLSDIESVAFGNTNTVLNDVENAPVSWAGKSLNLESKIALNFVFNPAGYTGELSDLTLRISYRDVNGNSKTLSVPNPRLYNGAMGLYVFTVDALLAAELRAVISARIYAGETPVSPTLQYSADTYGNQKTGTLLDLCKALFAYSDSAKAYFTN